MIHIITEKVNEIEIENREDPVPLPVIVDGEEEYLVEEILDSRVNRRKKQFQYLVKWKGYGPENNSWESLENVDGNTLVHDFHNRYPNKPKPKGYDSRGAV